MCTRKAWRIGASPGRRGFTLIEVLIALAVTGIGLAVLLHLQLASITASEYAERMSRATLLAQAKLAEVLATGQPAVGREEGRVEDEGSGTVFWWRTTVSPVESGVEGLDD